MGKGKLKRIFVTTLAFVMVSMLVAAIACTPKEAELLEGILQNVDAVNGEITIVTKDGKTMTLTIDTEAPVETEGASSALETLEPGASVEVEVNEDGQVVQRINARQAKVKGVIVQISGNEVTVESERGRRVTVIVTDRTRIKLEDDFPGILADLRIGVEAEIKFDPESRVAFKIDAEEEEAEIEGVIVQIDGDEVTIETERGRRLTLFVSNVTRIKLEDDFPGIKADLQVGIEVEAKFDPFTRIAFKIEVEEEEVASLGPPPAPTVERGTIEIRVTDPPPPEMDHIWVEIENLEVHKAGGSWSTIAVNPGEFDLKAIEGIEEFLASQVADVGRYTQLRLDVKTVTVVVGEDEHDAKVPSGKIKLVGTFEVIENNTTVITLDFDGKKSVLVTDGGNYIFKPVIKLLVSGAPGALEITTTSLPDGQVGVAYTATLEATGGTEPYTWNISDGSLPDGLTLDSDTGVISGTPTTEEDYSFTVQVEDSSDPLLSDTEEFSIDIEIGP